MAVHNIHMDQVRPGLLNHFDVLAKLRKIRRQNRRCNHNFHRNMHPFTNPEFTQNLLTVFIFFHLRQLPV